MGSRGRKSAARLARRRAAQPTATKTLGGKPDSAGHDQHVPGSQNPHKT